MALDPIILEAVVEELRDRLHQASVSKIFQTGSCELLIRFWTGRETLQLLLSVDPVSARLHLSDIKRPNPQSPPRFCQLLRARLRRLLQIERIPGERIVLLTFAGSDNARATLVLELLGSQANMLLLDDAGKIVDTLLRRDSGDRDLRPGQCYRLPAAPSRYDLLAGIPRLPVDGDVEEWLLHQVTPMSPLLAADLAAGAASGLPLEELLVTVRQRWSERQFAPQIGLWRGQPVLTALGPWFLPLEQAQSFDSPSAAVESFYAAALCDETFAGSRQQFLRLVARQRERLERRLLQLDVQSRQADDGERQKQFGDLLLANLHRLRRGMESIEVENWFVDPPEPVTIPLDPLLTPQANAERFYIRQRKGKRALEHARRRRTETEIELEWLQQLTFSLEEAASPAELGELQRELVEVGLLKEDRPGKGKTIGATLLRQTVSPGGYRMVWGKCNRGNDEISRRLAAPDDLWFHARGIPGCHLLLRREKRRGAIPEADILFAAGLAAGYSRGRDADRVEVMVAEGRAVRPVSGAPPGLVTVARYRTLLVEPRRLEEGGGS